jgi:hypothetical protein
MNLLNFDLGGVRSIWAAGSLGRFRVGATLATILRINEVDYLKQLGSGWPTIVQLIMAS